MTEYEWEVGRFPKASWVRGASGSPVRRHPIAEYAALEFPRESVTWVTSSLRSVEASRSRKKRSVPAAAEPPRPSPD